MNYSGSSSAEAVHINSTLSSALRSLLAGTIDYAGLFPPAELPLESALENHAQYVRSDESWMLNSFVLPAAQFPAASACFSRFDPEHPLRISALGAKTQNIAEFSAKLAATVEAIRQLQTEHRVEISVVQLEIPVPADCDLGLLKALHNATVKLGLRVFCEAPPAEAERTIALLAQDNTTRHAPLGFKLRTGGVSADAFPSADQIARALVAASRDHVPIKFTAGLHHPVRQFRTEVNTKMYGFLNVLGAGILAAEHGWDEATTVQMLEDEHPKSFVFEGDSFAWREWKITTDAIRSHREVITSFGSCSFDEPRDDLRALGLL
jgi:hypothetical protein